VDRYSGCSKNFKRALVTSMPRSFNWLAVELNLSRADVHGVVTFYRDFRSMPAGRTKVKVCRGEAWQAVGANQLVEAVERSLGAKIGQTIADSSTTLDQSAGTSLGTEHP